LLIDFLLGRCDEQTAEGVRQRLADDRDFARSHANISRAFQLLSAHPAPEPPEDLVDRTMARVRTLRQTEALIQAQTTARRLPRSTFNFHELAAVAAMLVLAAGVMIPSFRQAARQSNRVGCADNIGQIGRGIAQFASEHGERLPATPVAATAWLPRGQAKHARNSSALFALVSQKYADAAYFQCPAAGGLAFVPGAGMNDFPSARSISYSYQYNLDGRLRRDDPDLKAVASQMAILADANPVFPGGRFAPERLNATVSDNHGDGQNVLYLDGAVLWTTDCHVGVNGDNIFLAADTDEYTGSECPCSVTDTFLLPNPE
jgi:hypothetical protein